MLPKKYRLPAKEFPFLYKKGFKARGKYGMLIYKANERNSPQFGFVVSKKIGNAVARHKMTRLLRVASMEAVKEFELEGTGGSFEYIAFAFCEEFSTLKDEFFYQVKKLLSNEKDSIKSN